MIASVSTIGRAFHIHTTTTTPPQLNRNLKLKLELKPILAFTSTT